MNDSKPINNKTIHKTTIKEEITKTFLKRIENLDSKEQESLLKLYNEVIKEMK